ncbi:hypothetical protein HYI08_09645 [Clostridium botulinum]|nr:MULTISPECIES: hypothetical protein [Clostridium]MBY7025476.1 hypothetical protein [Clostridium botulinum]
MGQNRPCLNEWFIVWKIKRLAEKGCVKVECTGEKRFMLNYIRKLV